MKNLFVLLAIVIVFMIPAASLGNSISGTVSMKFDLSDHTKGKVAQLWIPYPVSNANQDITDVKINGNYVASAVYTDRKYQTPMLYARWDEGSKQRILNFSFKVDRQEITNDHLPDGEVAWDPADYAMYLGATRLGPVTGEVKKIAEKITQGKTNVKDKAKAIYDWACENTYRNPDTRGCGIGDVTQLLKNPGGKCTDISSIYVAVARAAGVPSREVFGIRQGKKPLTDISAWQHCWAEFYLPGQGWVPVDPADVRKMMLKQNLKLNDEKTKSYRDYFWGGIDAYRIKLSEGRDLILNPPQNGEPLNYLMYPYAQVGDRTLDWLDPETFKYEILWMK